MLDEEGEKTDFNGGDLGEGVGYAGGDCGAGLAGR